MPEPEDAGDAPVNIIIIAHYERTTRRYDEHGVRHVHIDAGHMGQNIYLPATALNLAPFRLVPSGTRR